MLCAGEMVVTNTSPEVPQAVGTAGSIDHSRMERRNDLILEGSIGASLIDDDKDLEGAVEVAYRGDLTSSFDIAEFYMQIGLAWQSLEGNGRIGPTAYIGTRLMAITPRIGVDASVGFQTLFDIESSDPFLNIAISFGPVFDIGRGVNIEAGLRMYAGLFRGQDNFPTAGFATYFRFAI